MNFLKLTFISLVLSLSTNAHAVLLERLDGMAYYDTEANLTWLADANYAKTSNYDLDGMMLWQEANDWAASLDINGVTGWRLPTTLQYDETCEIQTDLADYGKNCTGSEMSNLFYNVLGGLAGTSINTVHNDNYYLFSNIQTVDEYYWSATTFPHPFSDSIAFAFGFVNGNQGTSTKTLLPFHAWAVRTGDVAVVHEAATIWSLCTGFVIALGFTRRRKQKS